MKTSTILWIVGAAGAAWLLYSRSPAGVKSQLISYIKKNNGEPQRTALLNSIKPMNDQEIQDTSNYLFNYILKGVSLNNSDPLFARIQAISTKYNIFS